jgi:hypothetical protein
VTGQEHKHKYKYTVTETFVKDGKTYRVWTCECGDFYVR